MEPFSLIRFHPESGQFRSLSGAYIRVIPMRSTTKLNAHDLLGSRLKLNQQIELLDTLERCLNQIDRIQDLIQSTLNGGDRSTWLSWRAVLDVIPTEFVDEGRSSAIHWN